MNGISIVSDTNPLIYLLNGNLKAAEYLDGKQVWISATAIYLDLPLLTFDSDFHNIPELKLMILKP